MPIDLHERLSEFSYGYGVTREVERTLRAQGMSATPFLPSLLHEAELGFDVGFNLPGAPILLQFKLGQAMRRFVPAPCPPSLARPFWRYHIDTAEPDGQFELLLKAEIDGADVFYVAPKFHDWEAYLDAFERRQIARNSLIVRPSAIRGALDAHGLPDDYHKVVYDRLRAFLCSEPVDLETVSATDLGGKVRAHVESLGTPIAKVLERVFDGFDHRSQIRRPRLKTKKDEDRLAYEIASDNEDQNELRRNRLARLLANGRSRQEAIALAVGAEAWSAGAQLIFVTQSEKD
jgi:hypothetical protein